MIKVGILGAAGYTGGELIRLLLNHPEVEIVFANSESNAGNYVYDVHEGLLGDTELKFTSEMPFDKVDVIYFCFGHGKSEAFLKEHAILSMSRLSIWHRTSASQPLHTIMCTDFQKSTVQKQPSVSIWPTLDVSPLAFR